MSLNGLEQLQALVESGARAGSEPPGLGEGHVSSEENDKEQLTQIERDLDTLTYSGSTINELEIQLTQYRLQYKRVLSEAQARLDQLRKRLNSHIVKSEPFIDVWRKARLVQEESNKAAARFDKANSQYAASKEMMRVAELQLGAREVDMASPLNQAWQEMLNHATEKVFATELERRESELDHRRVLEKCQRVMEEYRLTERKLRTHIEKSRPFYLERSRANEKLQKLRQHIQGLEGKIRESKHEYSATLRRLEALNTEIHEQRRSSSTIGARSRSHTHHLGVKQADPRETASAGHSPPLHHHHHRLGGGGGGGGGGNSRSCESLESLHLGSVQYTGSTGSLPSTESSSLYSEHSPTPEPNGVPPVVRVNQKRVSPSADVVVPQGVGHVTSHVTSDAVVGVANGGEAPGIERADEEALARAVVEKCLASAVKKLIEEEGDRTSHDPSHDHAH